MEQNKHNILFHELIGLDIKVLSHSDPHFVGIRGRIIDETMNTLRILLNSNKVLIIPKRYGLFEIILPRDAKVIVDGSQIFGRPEDRLKKIKEL